MSDDRLLLIVLVAFFLGALWGYWLGHSDAEIDAIEEKASRERV